MEQLRAFIAVELPLRAREALEGVTADLQALALTGVRWVRPEGVHLTLKFLGNIGSASIEPISQAMSRCAASTAPFELSLGKVGAFPSLRAPRVIWVGLEGALEPLLGLQRTLEDELAGLGFIPERRPYSAHLTLGRIREGTPPAQRRRVGDALGQVLEAEDAELPVKDISLIKSTLAPTGATYTGLFSALLGRAP